MLKGKNKPDDESGKMWWLVEIAATEEKI